MEVAFFSGKHSFQRQWDDMAPFLDQVTESGEFTSGTLVRELEHALETYTGGQHAIAVANGTDALILALRAAGIGPGDEVIVPCFTFVASASSIAHVGATPVFADIDRTTWTLDPTEISKRVTPRTKAVMPVHLFVQMADMPAIEEAADSHGLLILEDSAEGIGMWCEGVHAGLRGTAGVLSFFPTKTLGAIGDAGMILTDDEALADTCRMLRNHGQREGEPYMHQVVGTNSRMDELQACVLLSRLRHLAREIARRAQLAAVYSRELEDLDPQVKTPVIVERPYAANSVHYVYLIEAEDRDGLVAYLNYRGVETETYYPIPLHLQPCFAQLEHREGEFPNAEWACRRTVALPLYPDMTEPQIKLVCNEIKAFYRRN